MNPDTGHLVFTSNMQEDEIQKLSKAGYEKIPKDLSFAAQMKLNGKKEAFVSLTSGGKLSKLAAKRRKAKRRQQKRSRKS